MAQGAFDQRLSRGRPMPRQNIGLERASVHADADRHAAAAGRSHHGAHALGPANVTGIDAQSVRAGLQCREREPVVEMDVCHQRQRRQGTHPLEDGSRLRVRNGQPHNVAPQVGGLADLTQQRLSIVRIGVRHGLHADGRTAADRHRAYEDLARLAARTHRRCCISLHGDYGSVLPPLHRVTDARPRQVLRFPPPPARAPSRAVPGYS